MRGALSLTRLDDAKSWHSLLVFTRNPNGAVRAAVIDNDDFPLAAPGLPRERLELHPERAGRIVTGNYGAELQGFAPAPRPRKIERRVPLKAVISHSVSRFVHGFPAIGSGIQSSVSETSMQTEVFRGEEAPERLQSDSFR